MPYVDDLYHVYIVPDRWGVSVDYLRITHQRRGNSQFIERLPQWIEYLQTLGYEKTAYQISTMKGWLLGKLAYIRSDTHEAVELRGEMADRWHVHYLHQTCKATRIDLALTVWLSEEDASLARALYYPAVAFYERQGKAAGRRPPVLYMSEAGDTLYLGSRTSRRYFRLYNKERQSGDAYYKNAWRFEVECKGDLAQVIWERLQARESVLSVGLDEVVGSLKAYNIVLPAPFDEGVLTKVAQPKHNKSIDAKLAWLTRQVRPTVKELSAKGYLAEVLEALDLHYE